MGKNNYFQFKQFRIEQENSAMKVGVDSVLLGAWVNVSGCLDILDIGTGTGLIALMLAQRSEARITAIEIEENAANEARLNITTSPWKERVTILHASLQEFAKTSSGNFDLIISNPPFFTRATRAAFAGRTLARHNDTLPFSELISLSSRLLTKAGRMALVFPVEAREEILLLAAENGLFLQRITEVWPKKSKKINRILLELGKNETALHKDCLTIFNEDGSYTEAYVGLTRDFYLKF